MLPSFAVAVIVALPLPTAVSFPALLTVTTFVLLLCQVTLLFVALDEKLLLLIDRSVPFFVRDTDVRFNASLLTFTTVGIFTVTLQVTFFFAAVFRGSRDCGAAVAHSCQPSGAVDRHDLRVAALPGHTLVVALDGEAVAFS